MWFLQTHLVRERLKPTHVGVLKPTTLSTRTHARPTADRRRDARVSIVTRLADVTEATASVAATVYAVSSAVVALVCAPVALAGQTAREVVEAALALVALASVDVLVHAQTLAVVHVTEVVARALRVAVARCVTSQNTRHHMTRQYSATVSSLTSTSELVAEAVRGGLTLVATSTDDVALALALTSDRVAHATARSLTLTVAL